MTETVKPGHKNSLHVVAIRAIYDESSRSVSLMLAGKAPFAQGVSSS